jgi:hypothetical protein
VTWGAPSWKKAAIAYRKGRAGRTLIVEIWPERLKLLRRLMDPAFELSHTWAALNDVNGRPTPRTTIEAVLHAVRERGPGALKEPATAERLERCDAAAKAEIERRIARLQKD